MNRSVRTACIAAAALVLLAGCSAPPKAGQVSTKDLASVRQTHQAVKIGSQREQVLASYKGANKVRLGTSSVEGVSIDEWKIEAFNDSKAGRDLFVTFLYFVGDTLVDVSDSRIDFRANPELVKRWAAAASK